MATRGGEEGDTLGSEYEGDEVSVENGEYYDNNDGSSSSVAGFRDQEHSGYVYDSNGIEGQDETSSAVPFEGILYRESLGFMRARRRLALPHVGLAEGEEDDGRLAALAVLDRFGLLLVSCATGEK